MTHISTSSRSTTGRIVRTLVALSIALAPFAIAADSVVTATVTAVNTLAFNGGSTIALAPTVAVDATDSSTILAFDTNSGLTYKITLVATAWGFTPTEGVADATGSFPVLSFVQSSTDDATGSSASAVLINAANTPGSTIDIVTAIMSVKGTATVELNASITQTVVAGSYSTTLTYAFFTY